MSVIPLLEQARAKFQDKMPEEAFVLCRHFIDKVAYYTNEKLQAELLLSEILMSLRRTEESLSALERCCAHFSINTLPADKLEVLTTLSYRKSDLGLYQAAAASWLDVAKYSAELGNVDFFMQALLGIGSLLEIVGENEGALNFFNQAELISNKSTSATMHARFNFHIVACYISLEKYEKAQKYLSFCKNNASLDVIIGFSALTHLYQAKIYRKQGRIKDALEEIIMGCHYIGNGLEPWTKTMLLLEQGNCFTGNKEALKGGLLLENALTSINGLGLYFIEQKINEALSDSYAQQGDFNLALRFEQKAHQIVLSLMDKIQVGKLECEYFSQLSKLQRLLMMQCTHQENQELKVQVEDHHDIVERLQHDAFTDPLTGVYNRRWLDDELENKVESYAALMIDADHFKSVNDNFSHQIGDHVLKRLATILASEIRPIDSVSRYGGEEFVILLCETNRQQILFLAERIRRAIEVAYWSDLLPGRAMTISIGGAVKKLNESGEQLLKRADRALYEAKAEGRNCFCFTDK